ncbi:exosome complex protein Rrp42 [Candidatus Woesearchaeota archaeon]|nr:exosome complex protein Rrp42 [Candidatus Woesearchaeota archaeon]
MNSELRQNVLKSLEAGIRLDGRKTDEYRKISVEYGISVNAEGSARVKIGETEILAGVKLSVESPYPDSPNQGTMMVGAELLPLSNPEFEAGPPGIQAIEIARVVDRGIRESETIDTKKLCIKEGEKAWTVIIDICTINDDGNLFDASALASMAALQNAVFPSYENEKIDYKKKTKEKLPLSKAPVSVTVMKIDKYFIVDPLPEEERILDARLTVATTEDGKICAMQKGGDTPLSIEDVDRMIDIAIEKTQELRGHLKR